MRLTKKIVIIGPAGTGKTTLKKVFFEMVNPLELLEKSLDPTKGIESIVYSFFDLDFAVFDLAGQENNIWFDKDKDIFINSNIIICVLDINSYLKDIIKFLNNLITLYNKMKLIDIEIVILLHKIDLIDGLYLQHKIKAINEFIDKEMKIDFKITIHTTSIAKKYFFKTFCLISELIIKISDKNKYLEFVFQNYKNDLEIILNYDYEKKYSTNDLFLDLNLSKKDAILHLKRLEKLGFIKLDEYSNNFKLTERVNFFKFGLESQKKDYEINKILEMFLIFSNINKKSLNSS